MNPVMVGTISFLLAVCGFSSLLLSMPRHYQDWFGRKPAHEHMRLARIAGFLLLGPSLALACASLDWSYGLVATFGSWTLASALVIAINCNCRRILARFGKAKV